MPVIISSRAIDMVAKKIPPEAFTHLMVIGYRLSVLAPIDDGRVPLRGVKLEARIP